MFHIQVLDIYCLPSCLASQYCRLQTTLDCSYLVSYFFCRLNLQLFETELKQSANKVQELKDKVTELLEKNPDSPEAPKWRQMLDKIGTSVKLYYSLEQFGTSFTMSFVMY